MVVDGRARSAAVRAYQPKYSFTPSASRELIGGARRWARRSRDWRSIATRRVSSSSRTASAPSRMSAGGPGRRRRARSACPPARWRATRSITEGWLMLSRTVSRDGALGRVRTLGQVEEAVRELVDRRVDPVEDPGPVEGLDEGRVERVVRARERGAEARRRLHDARARARRERGARAWGRPRGCSRRAALSRCPLRRITPPRRGLELAHAEGAAEAAARARRLAAAETVERVELGAARLPQPRLRIVKLVLISGRVAGVDRPGARSATRLPVPRRSTSVDVAAACARGCAASARTSTCAGAAQRAAAAAAPRRPGRRRCRPAARRPRAEPAEVPPAARAVAVEGRRAPVGQVACGCAARRP